MARYMSYAEQAAHYFDRPHDTIPDGPVRSPAAWEGRAVATSDRWRTRLDDDAVAEIEAAMAHARATGKDAWAAELEEEMKMMRFRWGEPEDEQLS